MGFIYIIKCTLNGFFYIGSSGSFSKYRKYRHFWELEKGIHGNRILQRCYNKYGKDSFKFEILQESIDTNILKDIENIWIGALNGMREDRRKGTNATDAYCSNISKLRITKSQKGSGMLGKRHSEESKLKTANSLRGRKRAPYKQRSKTKNQS